MTQLTFVPGELVPASGTFVRWNEPTIARNAVDPGLPDGVPTRLPTVRADAAQLTPIDVDGRRLELVAVVRALTALAPRSDWHEWHRPSDSILAWSAAAKLACELVAAGRVVPTVTLADDVDAVCASWRAVTEGDERIDLLAAALPPTAYAVRRANGTLPAPLEVLHAFLDAVADALARKGQRPALDARRRVVQGSYGDKLAAALTGVDPIVDRVRMGADELVAQMHTWGGPFLARERPVVRLALRLRAPTEGSDAWTLGIQLAPTAAPDERIAAADVWANAAGTLDVSGQPLVNPDLLLLEELTSAARLYAPLDAALSQAEPTDLVLTAAEVANLLDDGIDALAAAGVVVDIPAELRGDRLARVGLRLRIGRTADSDDTISPASLDMHSVLSGAYELAVGDDALTAEEFATLTANRQPLVRWRGQWVRVDASIPDAEQLAGASASLHLTEALASALMGRHHTDAFGWVATRTVGPIAALLDRLRAEARPDDAVVRDFSGTLRDYQRRGVAWLQGLASLGMGGVLADEMGLGKTIQAIALLTSRTGTLPHLVVCPTSVVGNWERELGRFAPTLPVVRHHGPERKVARSAMRPGHVVVTSYALLRRDMHLFAAIDWDVVIFDEAQQIKNASSKTARAARQLTSQVRLAMTGTPLENRLAELWAIIDVTNPGLLGSRRAFEERYAIPIERWHDDDAAERLRRLIAPFVLRRRKRDAEVSVDLPPKQELTETCTLTREQATLYRAAIDAVFADGLPANAFERRGRVLALLTALKQICNHPEQYLQEAGRLEGRSGKLTRVTELLDEIVAGGEHVLVFTQFRAMGTLLVEHLQAQLGLDEVPFLHGGVPLPAREAMVDRFQQDPSAPPILLVSLRAGGTGLNLTRATHVVHVDRWWNPAVEDQATDRAHRIGQDRSVTVHTMVTAGTIEERIAALLERKRALADAVVGSGEGWITDLDDDALRELVALSTDEFVDDAADEDLAEQAAPPRLRLVDGGQT